MSALPLFTIVTVVYNAVSDLNKTLESVKQQSFKNYDYVIIDGASTDGTAELIKENEHLFSYWLSEKDKGIYDAMNKGIAKAQGQYLLFLNAGDVLADDNVLKNISDNINDNDYSIVCGDAAFVYSDGKLRKRRAYKSYCKMATAHQSIFYKRELFEKYGCYDSVLRHSSDLEFWLRVFSAEKEKIICVPLTVSINNFDGVSNMRWDISYKEGLIAFWRYRSNGALLTIQGISLMLFGYLKMICISFLKKINLYNLILKLKNKEKIV